MIKKISLRQIFLGYYMYNAVGSEFYISSRGREFDHTFVEIDHELFSVVILLLPPIQEGVLPVMYRKVWLTAYIV